MTATTAGPAPGLRAAASGRSLAHGLAQIFFQSSTWTGLLLLAAFVVADWRMALLVVVGTVAGTVAGALLGAGADDVRLGMQGFCGALVGAAAYAALGAQGAAWLVAAVGGLACAPVTWLFVRLFASRPLARFGLPATTAPFCTVAGVAYALTADRHVHAATLHVTDGTGGTLARSVLTNVSEVVLVNSVWSGALILLGLLLASWRVGLAALMGSAVGSLAALALGESSSSIAEGLDGYSGVLTAVALSVVFLRSTPASWLYGAVGAALTAVVTVVMNHLTSGPAYTWPYILTTWVLLVVATGVPALRRP